MPETTGDKSGNADGDGGGGGAPSGGSGATTTTTTEVDASLRTQLRSAMERIRAREPLEPTYKRLLLNGVVTPRRPVLTKQDRAYAQRIGSHLRERVESYVSQTQGKDPFDRIAQRQPLEESALRAALTLRDAKQHEQQALLEATVKSFPRDRNGRDEAARKRHFDGVAAFLQSRHRPKRTAAAHGAAKYRKSPVPTASASASATASAEQTERARQQATLELQVEQARQREVARLRREQDEKRRELELEEKQRKQRSSAETPQQQLHRHMIAPIFQKLWDMTFPILGGTK